MAGIPQGVPWPVYHRVYLRVYKVYLRVYKVYPGCIREAMRRREPPIPWEKGRP